MKIEIEVADDSQLAADMSNWSNGEDYNLVVRQKTPMKSFDGISGEPVEPEVEEVDDEEAESAPPMPKPKGKSEMPPALMIVMGKRK